MSHSGTILVVCGLLKEARLAGRPGATAVAGGGRSDLLRERLAAIDPGSISAVVSFGLAGALDRGLRVGDILLPDLVTSERGSYPASAEVTRRWASLLRSDAADLPIARPVIVGVDRPALTVEDKKTLSAATGAGAVDMESHVAAAYAARHALPFGVLRVVSDAADRSLPPVAGQAMRPDGTISVPTVLTSLLRSPGQIPALIGTARDADRAFRVLGRVGRLLGAGLGLHL